MNASNMDEMSKQGLYLWLRSVVETGRCSGVTWIDEANGVFQIPWSNQKSRTWQKEDSSVFLEYAKHTCKYKSGNKMDFPKWKQNLKSAINKNRYIERLRSQDHLSGPKPFRVYRFMNEKAERKKSSDDFADVVKNATDGCLFQARLSPIGHAEGAAVSKEVFADQNYSGAVIVYSDNESSRSSPLSTTLQVGFSLSPDIPRSDSCDFIPGNIPTIVSSYCDPKRDFLSGDESLNSMLPESTLTEKLQTVPSTTELPTCFKIDQHGHSSDKNQTRFFNSFVGTQRNENQRLCQPQMLINKTTQKQIQPEILSQSMITDGHDKAPFKSVRQDSVHARRRQGTDQTAGVTDQQMSNYPGTFSQSVLNSNRDHFLSLSQPVTLDPGPAIPVISVHNEAFQNFLGDPSMKMPQTGQVIHCGINIDKNTSIGDEMPTSLSELEIFGKCSSDQPSSMDTYDSNSGQQFQGSQFTNYRHEQKPEATSQATSIPPSVTTMTDDTVMHVQVLYGTPHRTVKKIAVTSQKGSCRLFYGSVKCSVMQNAIRGQQDAEEVELPPVETPNNEISYDTDKQTAICNILKGMELGIVISYSNDDIFVERRCLPKVFLSDGVSKNDDLPRSTKKRPDVKTLAFDYNKHFKESIELNKTNNNAVPKDHFLLTIGYQIIPNDDSPTRMVPVYIVVRHVKAAMERFKILGASTIAPNPMCSDPNSFDKNIELFKDIDLK